eukprot:2088355-Amphidinium_carterae.1
MARTLLQVGLHTRNNIGVGALNLFVRSSAPASTVEQNACTSGSSDMVLRGSPWLQVVHGFDKVESLGRCSTSRLRRASAAGRHCHRLEIHWRKRLQEVSCQPVCLHLVARCCCSSAGL